MLERERERESEREREREREKMGSDVREWGFVCVCACGFVTL